MPARAVLPNLIEGRFRAVRKAGRRLGAADSPPDDYHRLRIRCKRLRYALEFSSDVYVGHTKTLVRRLVALQDILGLSQDAEVAIDRLRSLATDAGSGLPPETVFAMGEIAERYRYGMSESLHRFPGAYAKATGKVWKTFRSFIVAQDPGDRPTEGVVSEEFVELSAGA